MACQAVVVLRNLWGDISRNSGGKVHLGCAVLADDRKFFREVGNVYECKSYGWLFDEHGAGQGDCGKSGR